MIFILLLFTHMKMKKMLLGIFLGMFTLAGIAILPNYANAQEWDGQPEETTEDGVPEWFLSDWWSKQDTKYNANVAGSDQLRKDNLIKTIRTAINWVLGILSMIALVLCLWGGFKMMTSGGDSKKYEDWLNILKCAAIGLAIIAASWLIVSLIFFVINGSIGGWNEWEITWQGAQTNTNN